MTKMNLKEWMKDLEEETRSEEEALFGTQRLSPDIQSMIKLLEQNPLLVKPTLYWIQNKIASLQAIQLLQLYTTEQLKTMFKPKEWQKFKELYGIKENGEV